MKNIKIIFSVFTFTAVAAYLYYQPNIDTRNSDSNIAFASILPIKPNEKVEVLPPQRVHPVRISNDVFFAGEKVPLNDLDVRERFDKELMVNTFWHSNTMLNYKLANKYFVIIDKILLEEGIPLDFRYLAVAERGLRNVRSPAGACGMWQIMKATGKSYGLSINDEIDERYHLEKSTKVACDYLNEAKKKFGSWALASASYNMGMPGLQKRLNEQLVDNYYDLYLNTETARYMYRILAYKMVFENTKKFGLNIEEEDLYEPLEYETINMDSTIENLAQFAIKHNTTYKMLKVANPWLRAKSLSIKEGDVVSLKLPKNYVD
jgi:hypothetical protein